VKHAIEMGSGAVIHVRSFIKIGLGIHICFVAGDTCTDTDSNVSLLLLYFSQNRVSKPRELSKISPTVACTECCHSRKH
jgi:hypothetical protein